MGKAKAKTGKTSKAGKKKPVKVKKFTENELKALELVAEDPIKSNRQIGREMKDLGLVKDENYLNTNRKQRVREKRDKLQELGQLQITKLVPLAGVKLKDKLNKGDPALKAIDIALKHGLGRPDEAQVRIDTINIDTLNVLQSNQLSTITQRLDELEPDESA